MLQFCVRDLIREILVKKPTDFAVDWFVAGPPIVMQNLRARLTLLHHVVFNPQPDLFGFCRVPPVKVNIALNDWLTPQSNLELQSRSISYFFPGKPLIKMNKALRVWNEPFIGDGWVVKPRQISQLHSEIGIV